MPSTLKYLVSAVTSPNSAGESKVTLNEAHKLTEAASKNGIVSSTEKDILTDLVRTGALTPKAKLHLETLTGPVASSETKAGIGPNKLTITDLQINEDGYPLRNGKVSSDAWIDCAETLAEFHRESSSDMLKDLPLSTRTALLENAIFELKDPAGSNAAQRRQVRSSAFTITYALIDSLPNSNRTRLLQQKGAKALVNAAKEEANPRLAKHITRLLLQPGFQSKLTHPQKKVVKKLFEEFNPKSFDVGSILDKDGYITWEHSAGYGENMYRSYVANLTQSEIGGASFKVVNRTKETTDLEVTFKQSRGKGGRIKGIRVHVSQYDDDFFNSVGKPVGISYGGHSGVGKAQERSLANAMNLGVYAEKPQLIFLDLCAGMDGLDDAVENLGNVHFLTTFDSSLYYPGKMKDENGAFKGIAESEMKDSMFALWESLSREENYAQIKNRIKKVIPEEDHVIHPNYVFHDLKSYKEVRWAHQDIDDDGVADALDIHYRFDLVNPHKSLSYKLKPRSNYGKLNGDTVRDAVLDLNVSTHYNGLLSEDHQIVHNFMHGGFFDGKDSKELVRFVDVTNTDGITYTSVQVNSGLSHTSREALGALVHYYGMVELVDRGVIKGDFNEKDRKLLGLVFAAARLTFDQNEYKTDERTWKKMLKALELPASIPYEPLVIRLGKEKKDYSGNATIMRSYKKNLSAETLKELNKPTVGRPGKSSSTGTV